METAQSPLDEFKQCVYGRVLFLSWQRLALVADTCAQRVAHCRECVAHRRIHHWQSPVAWGIRYEPQQVRPKSVGSRHQHALCFGGHLRTIVGTPFETSALGGVYRRAFDGLFRGSLSAHLPLCFYAYRVPPFRGASLGGCYPDDGVCAHYLYMDYSLRGKSAYFVR